VVDIGDGSIEVEACNALLYREVSHPSAGNDMSEMLDFVMQPLQVSRDQHFSFRGDGPPGVAILVMTHMLDIWPSIGYEVVVSVGGVENSKVVTGQFSQQSRQADARCVCARPSLYLLVIARANENKSGCSRISRRELVASGQWR
jgi:hypothetical protein